MNHIKPLILIVDDETTILHTLKNALEDEMFVVETLADGKNVLETIGKLVPDLVLLDIFIPNHNGIDLLTAIKKEYPSQKLIMISGFGTIQIALESMKKGALDFIEKPLNLDEILAKITFLKQKSSTAINEPAIANTAVDRCNIGIVGASALFCELMQHISLIAPLDLPTLIYGPPGSGKSLFAQYIHSTSKCACQPITTLHCATLATLPSNMLTSGGTLFLKNIQHLKTSIQKELVAYLAQDQTPTRIIASCTSTIFKQVQDGTFNRSLFAKLNVTPLEIPSINKRRYDIPLLIENFVDQWNKKYHKQVSLSAPAIRFLRNYQWVGDIAQIKTYLQTLIQTAPQTKIIIEMDNLKRTLPEQSTSFLEEQLFSRFNSIEHATETFQRHYISHLLRTYRYDTAQLAEFLKMPIAQLHDKMVELHINVR